MHVPLVPGALPPPMASVTLAGGESGSKPEALYDWMYDAVG